MLKKPERSGLARNHGRESVRDEVKSNRRFVRSRKYKVQRPAATRPIEVHLQTEILALKHESRILGLRTAVQPCIRFRKSQASSPWTKQHRV